MGLNHDPGIPRNRGNPHNPRGKKAHTTVGWLARTGDGALVLESHRGATWPLEFVSIMQGMYGSGDNTEGMSKLPRERVYDGQGAVIIEGDRVIINFLDGNSSLPIICGGVRGVKVSSFLPYNTERDGADANRLAGRLCPLNADGKVQGIIEWEMAYGESAAVKLSVHPVVNGDPSPDTPAGPKTYVALDASDGSIQMGTATGEVIRMADGQVSIQTGSGHTIALTKDGGVQIAQSDGNDPPGGEVMLEFKDGVAKISAVNAIQLLAGSIELGNGVLPPTDKYILSGAFLADIAGLSADVTALGLAGTGGPPVPIPTPGALTLTAGVGTSLAAGPPYLSNLTKGQ